MNSSDYIELGPKFWRSGLYESYYFRGNNIDKTNSFWLKHNFLLETGGDRLKIDFTVVLFDHLSKEVITDSKRFSLPLIKFWQMREKWEKSWHQFSWEEDGQRVTLEKSKAQGLIESDQIIRWDLIWNNLGEQYFHFDKPWFYRGFFPKKKLMTVNTFLKFEGSLSIGDKSISGQFLGMNGHNWGKEHAPHYVYGNCNQFDQKGDHYFDGFTARIRPVKYLGATPPLSLGSLKVDGTWFHFNRVLHSWKHQVDQFDATTWEVTFENDQYYLECLLEGKYSLWSQLVYDHPNGNKSIIENTKDCSARFKLIDRKTKQLQALLTGRWAELESTFENNEKMSELTKKL